MMKEISEDVEGVIKSAFFAESADLCPQRCWLWGSMAQNLDAIHSMEDWESYIERAFNLMETQRIKRYVYYYYILRREIRKLDPVMSIASTTSETLIPPVGHLCATVDTYLYRRCYGTLRYRCHPG